jgi:hypothetical protein
MAAQWQTVLGAMFLSVSLLTGMVLAADSVEEGFTNLTDSDARDHWLGYGMDAAENTWPANWEFADGVLHAKGGGNDLKTRDEFGDFDLRFDWKISPKGNSGVMYRVSQETDPAYFTGPEYQVIDDVGNEDAVSPDTSSASCYALYAPNKQMAKPAREWNEGRIIVKDNHVEHYLNGEKVTEYKLGSDDWNKRVAGSKFGEWKKFGKNSQGVIDLQDHGNEVWYRNVRIKKLDGPAQGN